MAYNTIDDIIKFVKAYGEKLGRTLQGDEIAEFVKQLQQEISKMDFSVPKGTTVIAYTGQYNAVKMYETADAVSEALGNKAIYISNMPAGNLLDNNKFKDIVKELVGKENFPKILSGYTDGTWTKRIPNGSCGFGENLLSLDDFVSKKLMGETKGANSNLIVLTPAGIDGTKVFGATELEAIFKNDTFKTINGIPKAQLQEIYHTGANGVQAVYDILTATAKEAVGNTGTIIDILIVNLSAN